VPDRLSPYDIKKSLKNQTIAYKNQEERIWGDFKIQGKAFREIAK